MSFSTQAFLPYITQDNRILGIVPIPSTVFEGTETTIVGHPLRAVSFQQVSMPTWQENKIVQYMGIPVTPTQEREFQNPAQINQYQPFTLWQGAPGFSFLDYRSNTLLGLLAGTKITATVSPPPSAPTASAGSVTSYALSANFHLSHSCTFIETNWMTLTGTVSGNSDVASIKIGAPSIDPSNGGLKAYVVSTNPAMATLNSMMKNTIRFVKVVEGPIPNGAYVYPVTITNTAGLSTNTTITVNVGG